MNDNITLRMRDVALCLYHAQKHDIVLSKIQLQKIIYLQDCLNTFLYILSVEKGHITYYYGPYDKNIQNAADLLVFHLLADAINIRISEKDISCDYMLFDTGIKWIESLIVNNNLVKKRSLITKGLIDSIIARSLLNKVVELVYSEPIFVKSQRSGYGITLDFNDLNGNDVFSYLTIVLDVFDSQKKDVSIAFLCDLLLDYLDKRITTLAVNELEG